MDILGEQNDIYLLANFIKGNKIKDTQIALTKLKHSERTQSPTLTHTQTKTHTTSVIHTQGQTQS